jgi:hypothetical protein
MQRLRLQSLSMCTLLVGLLLSLDVWSCPVTSLLGDWEHSSGRSRVNVTASW